MADVGAFITAPSEEGFGGCTKEQLLKIAAHYEIIISDKGLKDTVKRVFKDKLSEMGVLTAEQSQPDTVDLSPALLCMATGGLTFEQQREMLVLQLEHDKLRWRSSWWWKCGGPRLKRQDWLCSSVDWT